MTPINIEDNFTRSCKKLGIKPEPILFHTTKGVKQELNRIASENDCTLQELLRILTDDFLEHQPE